MIQCPRILASCTRDSKVEVSVEDDSYNLSWTVSVNLRVDVTCRFK
jgi:hypothetical protein